MTRTATVTVTLLLDEDGETQLISVPLTNIDRSAILWKDDFDLLMSLGVSPEWRLNANLVLPKGKQTPIARLVKDAKKGDKVRYLDGDPLNLKGTNLVIVQGAGKSNARERQLNRPIPFKTGKVKLQYKNIPPSWIDGLAN
jgi:hypothetical protein